MNERDMLLGQIKELTHELDIIVNRLDDIENKENSNDPHYSAKKTLKAWGNIKDDNDMYKCIHEYVKSLETTITELREDVQSDFNKNNYQLKFQHDNYEKRIEELKRELEAEVMLKEIYRDGVLKNRIYYCLKNKNGECYKYLFNVTAIFATWEEASFVSKHITDPGYEVQMYTGE
jgi:chaperonin cofactor prefoldin